RAANPVPQINQPLVPASTAPGGAGFTLTLNGAGFVSGAAVKWNGSSRTTTFVSSIQLTAKINSSDISKAITASITVVNPSPGGGTSNVVFFQVTPSATEVSFSGGSAPTASGPLSVVAADFNSDGKQDLAVANESADSVSILLGNGNGTFQSHVDYATGLGPQDVVVGDFNGDGKLDLAVADAGENSQGQVADTVSILLGNGNGTFQSHVDYATGQVPVRIAIGDFNGDGKLDLAVVNQLASTVSILLGNGNGTFQAHVDYSVGLEPSAVVVGDFNRDDKLDLAVANFSTQTVSVLIGNGNGTFQSAVDYPAFLDPVAVVAADFNGDGKLDLAVPGLVSSSVAVLLGNGDGTFDAPAFYSTGQYPESVATGDFNGDGILDLALPTDSSLGTISVLLGKGDGSFQSAANFPSGLLPVAITTADFNNDGKLDVATADLDGNAVSALLETTVLLSPATVTFTSQNIGTTSAPETVTLTNIGTTSVSVSSIATALPFAETNTCSSSLNAGASCTASITFTPTTPGASTGSLTATDGAVGSPQVVSLSGSSTGSFVSLSPASLNFGSVNVGSVSSKQSVTLTNTGNATLNITSISTSGDYSESSNQCGSSLAPAASCTINVTFKPTAGGTRSGTLSVTDNAYGSPQTVSLTGIGLAPQVQLSPASLTFGLQVVNTTSPAQKVTLTNTGTAALTINSIALNGSNPGSFAETNTCGSSVGAGSSCTISVTFAPVSPGSPTANVSVRDNATGSPQTVALSGTATAMSFSPTSLNFGTVKVGQSSNPQTATLTNLGTSTVSITSVSITGTDPVDFSETNNCGSKLYPAQTCTFTLTFTPAVAGSRSASLSVADTGGGSPQTVALSGTGTAGAGPR
ncbi:MAG TPA: choice-of-anchor D domain-containing protein, partial [Terriglobia bacterium]